MNPKMFLVVMASTLFCTTAISLAPSYYDEEEYRDWGKAQEHKDHKLSDNVFKRSCQCKDETLERDGLGSGTRFWVKGCGEGWYDCKPGSGLVSKCCRKKKPPPSERPPGVCVDCF